MIDVSNDPRIDPRIKTVLSGLGTPGGGGDADSREQLLAEASSEEAIAQRAMITTLLDAADNEDVAPSKGLNVTEHSVASQPDGNTINLRFIRPDGQRRRSPRVYYIHGGGMQTMSCYDGNYRAWGRIIAAQGVAVAMVDFRNALTPSSVEEVAPFPAGLNDCVSGVQLARRERAPTSASTPPASSIAGESGGGNLTLATGLS